MEVGVVLSKKATKKSSKKAHAKSRRDGKLQLTRFPGADNRMLPLYIIEANHPYPVYLNPESAEEREKRLAARKARTLRIFQTAYENHHRRKDSR
jgi:hypothetical protein